MRLKDWKTNPLQKSATKEGKHSAYEDLFQLEDTTTAKIKKNPKSLFVLFLQFRQTKQRKVGILSLGIYSYVFFFEKKIRGMIDYPFYFQIEWDYLSTFFLLGRI